MCQFVKYLSVFLLLSAASCAPNITEHGNKIADRDLAKLRINGTKQILVPEIIGPPTLVSQVEDQERWYYISYERKRYPLRYPTFSRHDIIELSFKEQRLVNLKKYDLDDLEQIAFVPNRRYTNTRSPNFWQQLLRNIGRFDGVSDI